jgi:hypothetical protein
MQITHINTSMSRGAILNFRLGSQAQRLRIEFDSGIPRELSHSLVHTRPILSTCITEFHQPRLHAATAAWATGCSTKSYVMV